MATALQQIALILAHGLLACRGERVASAVQFRGKGTAEFKPLFTKSDAEIITLLNRAAADLTRGDKTQWAISACDPTIALVHYNRLSVVLHPVNINVAQLTVVPPDVLIFSIDRETPHTVTQESDYPPDYIATRRQEQVVAAAEAQWKLAESAKARELRTFAKAELKRKRNQLTPAILQVVEWLLSPAQQQDDLRPVLRALFHLGSWPNTFKK